jgi:hypothetical protein
MATPAAVMEQVAMYMASLPCPPLPLVVSDGERRYCNSHDFIASLLITAMVHGNAKLNKARKKKQLELTEKLLREMRACGGDVVRAYGHFSEFTAGYICAFANIDVGVTFMPLGEVEDGDAVHKACCSWHRAQAIILGEPADEAESDYSGLLACHCRRFEAA